MAQGLLFYTEFYVPKDLRCLRSLMTFSTFIPLSRFATALLR